MKRFSILVVLFLIKTLIGERSGDKRLLLSDPDVILNRLIALEQTVKLQADRIALLETGSSTRTGSTYIRWGRTVCPGNNTNTIYSGYAGGSKYTYSGGAAENVCLPPDPDYDRTDGTPSGFMFGSEYNNNFFGQGADPQDVPCAVCEVVGATSTIMIPGKNACYHGWKMEYTGYLSAHSLTYVATSSFACVDQHPQFLPGGHVQYDEHLFGLVGSKCGSLPCPPYRDGVPMTCVVCSK